MKVRTGTDIIIIIIIIIRAPMAKEHKVTNNDQVSSFEESHLKYD
jgi:hypothetical protein